MHFDKYWHLDIFDQRIFNFGEENMPIFPIFEKVAETQNTVKKEVLFERHKNAKVVSSDSPQFVSMDVCINFIVH